MNLDLAARHPHSFLRHVPALERLSNVAWRKAAFIGVWEGQSHLASLAYVGLVAFASIWVALGAMLVWSLIATVAFCTARERGYPNLLSSVNAPRRGASNIISYAALSLLRAWLAGMNAFIYSRCSGSLITARSGSCRARRLARVGALAVGLTLFGASSAEHLLRTAGYTGKRLVRMSLIGPFLHVPYRVMVSAAVVALVTDALEIVHI